MNINFVIKYILKQTISDMQIGFCKVIDFILPDFLIFTPLRSVVRRLIGKIGIKTRIKKLQHFTHVNNIVIGNNCYINRNNTFDNQSLISIGNDCSIGYNNLFITTTHLEKKENEISKKIYTTVSKPITIGNNVWITSNCTILPGVSIGDNVIIAGSSLVNKDCEAGRVYGGIPSKKIRKTNGFIPKNI